jgi:hypothetical protein
MATDTPTEYEGEQIGKSFGYTEDEELTIYPMTPELHRRWHNIRQATPSLAYALMGIFDNDDYDEQESEWYE